uniref:Uncharacterized protein n=1 Tax=viral metagenome TaxID=1070528 RepID=A0A6C0DSM3_9ZZZZ
MSKPSAPVVLPVSDWTPSSIKYMPPKVNDRGGKSINIISTQSNRSLHIATPLMMTWGISDYVDEKTGESDGKFTMSLNFPNADYETAASKEFLEKMTAFENQILDDMVKNSEAWIGEQMPREVVKHTFFPSLKYSKDKTTKKIDHTKPPSLRVKVPNYGGRWAVEIYDTTSNKIFPCENENLSPIDFIPKKSNVACVLQCSGIWFGGKAAGVTWKLVQCVVKPQAVVSVFGRCHIQLSEDEIGRMDKPVTSAVADDEEDSAVAAVVSTEVADSDAEEEEEEPEPEPVKPVKKIVKKAVAEPVAAPAAVEAEVAEEVAKPVKKVVKKKVVA